MGKTLARKFNGMSLWSKIGIIFMLLTGILVYQGVFKPGFLNSATNTYYFTTDTTAVNVGADGSTNTTATLNGKISLKTGIYNTSRSVSAASNTTAQSMLRAYGPAYGTMQTVTAPVVTIGVRDRNGTANTINWWAEVYDYTPSGAANNGTLLWTSNTVEAHPSVQTPLELPFANPLPKDIAAGHRLKVVIKCQQSNTASLARLYWGNSTNYSFFTVTEANYVANSLTVTNLSDYYAGSLTNVTQGDTNIPMLKWDMYSNVVGGATWSGGKLDRIGNNVSLYQNPDEPGDVSFSIWKDTDGDGIFETTDTKIGGPYTFTQLTGQTYNLATNQVITTTPQRYFVTYDVLRTAMPSTTIGALIANSTYFTVAGAAGGVQNVTSTSSSTPNIDYGGVAVSKVYKADWDNGTTLVGISESGGTQPSPNQTDSACITRNTNGSGFPLVGLINYPAHSCTSVAGQGYLNASGSTQADFARLYFGGTGYASAMKSVKGTSFTYRVYFPSAGGTVTLRLFYVTSGGVRVNAPIASTYTRAASGSSANLAVTTSLAGQDFANVPQGARLGIQIGVTNNVRIGLGSANGMTGSSSGSNLTVQETAAENENVDVGNGTTVPNANVYAADTAKVLDSFTLNSAKPKTVTGITLTGNALFNSTNIKNVRIYQDTGTYGVHDGEAPIASGNLPGTSIVGNSISFSGLNLSITPTVRRYLVEVDIADTPNVNVIVKALVSGVTVATTGSLGNNTDSASATLTIQPTTTLTDGAAEPVSKIVNASQVPTLIDAFGLKTNGGLNDQVNTVTVTLSTASTVPAGHYLSEYVAKVEIVNQANTVVYGHLTSPTFLHLNEWQIATTNLYATVAGTECYVRITPKNNLGGTYVVKATVTNLSHLRTINQLPTPDDDITSASITLDGAAPNNPGNFTATTPPNAAAISLNWDPATDASGSAVSYTVVRGLGNAPVPQSCTPIAGKVLQVYQGVHPGTSPDVTENGLEEGVIYNYRICAIDGVGNTSLGSTASATAGIINRCDKAPTLKITPSSTYTKAGETKQLLVAVTNNDTGTCGSASTFHLTITGTPNTTDFDAPTLETNDFVLTTNGGAKYLKLNVTAKDGAPYQAMNHFGLKVDKSGASVATVIHDDPVHVVVNKYGAMMHSSMQLGTAKYGAWGTEYDCSTCHSDSTSNIKRVADSIVTPTGVRPVVFTTLSASVSVTSGVFGNDKRSGTTSTNVCEVCHHKARYHQYSSSKVAWDVHNNSADCMRCHDHRFGFKTISEGRRCTDCHGEPPLTQAQLVVPPTNVLFPYATGSDAGAHSKHNDRKLNCQACHNNGNHLISAAPDSKLNIGFSIRSSHFPGFNPNVTISSGVFKSVTPGNDYVYEAGAGTDIQPAFDKVMTCSVYCHGYWNGSYTTSGGYNTEPSWSGTTQTGCGSCHGASGSQPPPSGSHSKHAGTLQGYGNGIACTKCHGFRNYSTSAQHINGNVEWDLSSITTTATYKDANKGSTGAIAPTAPGSYSHCDNLYCHSNVQSANGTAGPTTFGTPTWGGSVTCGNCHTHSDTGGHVSGGHSQHTAPPDVEGFDCRICHGNGGSTNSLNHANGKINFSFGGLAENTHYSYSSAKTPGSAPYGTCYNSNCHGRRTITWGPSTATPLCNKCHATTLSNGFYGTAGPSSTKLNTDPYVGAHFQHLTSMPFKFSAKYDCIQCHVKPTDPYSPGHIDTALSAEINFVHMSSLANRGAQNGYSSAGHQPSYNYATRQCNNVWCHGAGMNSNEGTGPYGSVGPTLDGGTLGAPDAKAAIWNQPFLATAADKCQTCHSSPPAAPESGYMHFDDDTGAPYARNKCTNCHRELNADATGFAQPQLHVNGIIDSCYNCHGRPPIDDDTMTKPALGALGVGMVGAHQAHRLNPAIGNDCSACHYNFTYDMPSYKLEIGFHAYGNQVTKGIFYGMSTLPSVGYSQPIVYFSTWTSTKVRRTNNTTKINTCENVYCHGGGTNTLSPLGGGSNNKPNWEAGSSQAVCGACHGVTGETYRSRGSHGAHVGTLFGEPHLACANCHGIKENNYHVDGKVGWEFYSSAKRMNNAAQAAGYAGTFGYKPAGVGVFAASGFANNLAPSASYGTCQVYCHSDPSDKTFKIPTWGGAPMTCDSCHKNQTSVGRFSGSHQKHAASTANSGYGIECMMCHYGSGAGNPLHVNGTVDIIFNPMLAGSATYTPGGTPGSGTCKNISCHVSDASNGPTWGNAGTLATYPATCTGCHSGVVGNRDAIVPQFGYESHHVQRSDGTLQSTDCAMCHWEGDNSGGKNPAYHAGSLSSTGNAVNLVVWNTSNVGAKTPANRPAISAATFVSYTANGNRTSIAKLNNVCLGCHNLANAAFQPFGDGKVPQQYAWDNTAVATKYNDAATTPWGKTNSTTYANANNKDTATKAFSAHGNAIANKRGWDTTNGTDTITYTAPATSNVVCFDCHNSHGTAASGIMSSYSSATGRYKGGILKSTTANIGGYTATYTPTSGGSTGTKDLYNTGAGLCFDCHGNQTSSASYPWGYNDTYGIPAGKPIYGYMDSLKFSGSGAGTFPSATRNAYKAGTANAKNANVGGHFGKSSAMATTPLNQVNNICTPCHDPHGVSPTLNKPYAVPLLKGTWITSPYDEDVAADTGTTTLTNKRGGGSKQTPMTGGALPGYHIDQNTLQANKSTVAQATGNNLAWTWGTVAKATLQPYSSSQFGGLCMKCHAKAALVYPNTTTASAGNWKKMRRVHQSVWGWASNAGSGTNKNNVKHAFSCAKCHTVHNYRLPRLLVTNCLDYNHRGRVVSGGTIAANPSNGSNTAGNQTSTSYSTGKGAGRFPGGGGRYSGTKSIGSSGNTTRFPGPWFFGTVQGGAGTSTATCHDAATAGNTYPSMKWNNVTQW